MNSYNETILRKKEAELQHFQSQNNLSTIYRIRHILTLMNNIILGRSNLIDIDGTIAETTSECMEGIGLSYKGTWGYSPLIVTLSNTREHLFIENRSGNTHSSKKCRRNVKESNRYSFTLFKEYKL